MNLRRRWYAVYADALGVADELLRIVQYGTPNARTWTMALEGACGDVTRRFECVSHTSADHVRDLCHRAWAEWVADTLAPGRALEDWTIALPSPEPRRVVHHKRDGLPKVRSRRTTVLG